MPTQWTHAEREVYVYLHEMYDYSFYRIFTA